MARLQQQRRQQQPQQLSRNRSVRSCTKQLRSRSRTMRRCLSGPAGGEESRLTPRRSGQRGVAAVRPRDPSSRAATRPTAAEQTSMVRLLRLHAPLCLLHVTPQPMKLSKPLLIHIMVVVHNREKFMLGHIKCRAAAEYGRCSSRED